MHDLKSAQSELTAVDFLRLTREESKDSFRIDAASVLKGKSFAGVKQQIRQMIETHFAISQDQSTFDIEMEDVFTDYLSPVQLEKCLRVMMPILKLDKNRYMIGTLQKQLILKNEHLVIRVGGGFMDFDQYVRQEAKIECLKILKRMEQH